MSNFAKIHIKQLRKLLKLLDSGEVNQVKTDLRNRIKNLEVDKNQNKKKPTPNKVKVDEDTEDFDLKETANKFRDKLIKHQTEAETKLKALLKCYNIKYEFQKIFYYSKEKGQSFYIVDFYLPTNKMIIEVDGGYHNHSEQKKLDRARSKIIKNSYDIKDVIRISNSSILNQTKELEEQLMDLQR
jgi:very-short-patch-repair endonuclease